MWVDTMIVIRWLVEGRSRGSVFREVFQVINIFNYRRKKEPGKWFGMFKLKPAAYIQNLPEHLLGDVKESELARL